LTIKKRPSGENENTKKTARRPARSAPAASRPASTPAAKGGPPKRPAPPATGARRPPAPGAAARRPAAKPSAPKPRIHASHAEGSRPSMGRPAPGRPAPGRPAPGRPIAGRRPRAAVPTDDRGEATATSDLLAPGLKLPRSAAAARKPPLAAPKRAPGVAAARRAAPAEPVAEPSTAARELALALASAGIDKKAIAIEILDVTGKVDYADFLVVMTGRSDRHVHAIATGLEEEMRKRKLAPLSMEGLQAATWVLIDFGDVVVHVFQEDARAIYDIEGLWIDAGRVPVPDAEKAEGFAPRSPSAD